MSLVIPAAVVYAGLAGCLLALLVATWQQRWRPRVFFLLALRLAIGWHFLFEGLYKVQSHMVGESALNRPFSSEMYFNAAEGPFGEYMRKEAIGDPDADIAARVAPQQDKLAGFADLPTADQAALCPAPVAAALEQAARDGMAAAEADVPKTKEEAEKAKADYAAKVHLLKADIDKAKAALKTAEEAAEKADAAAEKAKAVALLAEDQPDKAKLDEERKQADEARKKAEEAAVAVSAAAHKVEVAEKADADAKKKFDDAAAKAEAAVARVNALKDDGRLLKATYARWVYGLERRDSKAKYIGSDVPQTVPERLAHIALLTQTRDAVAARQAEGLGNGYGMDQKKGAAARSDVTAAKVALVSDADAFAADLVRYAGGTPVEPEKPIKKMDTLTMWFLVAVGACLIAGLFTRLSAVAAAGFLVLTYLTHPPFPWYPLPPGTEGNPLFINKNVIEALALLVIVCYPTGRWLGLDAVIHYLLFGKKKT